LMTGIRAQANQAKKHTKNAIHVRWNAPHGRRRREERDARCFLAGQWLQSIPLIKQNGARPRRCRSARADAVVRVVRRWTVVRVFRGSPFDPSLLFSKRRASALHGTPLSAHGLRQSWHWRCTDASSWCAQEPERDSAYQTLSDS
jgi:hypothetical protein